MLIFLVLFALAACYAAAERNRTLRLRTKARRLLASIERTEALCDSFLAQDLSEPENVIRVDFKNS